MPEDFDLKLFCSSCVRFVDLDFFCFCLATRVCRQKVRVLKKLFGQRLVLLLLLLATSYYYSLLVVLLLLRSTVINPFCFTVGLTGIVDSCWHPCRRWCDVCRFCFGFFHVALKCLFQLFCLFPFHLIVRRRVRIVFVSLRDRNGYN